MQEQKQKQEGTIFNIQRFSIHDGPGTRTTIFFKGCNLKCVWCHNPESITFKKQVEIYQQHCIGCGACFKLCPNNAHYTTESGVHKIDREKCKGCFTCTENCFSGALAGVGTVVDVDYVIRSIMTDELYYKNSGGGVTFSGGECMLQIDFLHSILTECKKRGIHTAVDTAGNVPWKYFEKIIDVTDLFLYDIKSADSKLHEKYTGVGNSLIIENLVKLSHSGKDIYIRIPFIPGLNDGQIEAIGDLIKNINIIRVEVLPYHKLGNSKYAALDLDNTLEGLEAPSDKIVKEAVQCLQRKGIPTFRS